MKQLVVGLLVGALCVLAGVAALAGLRRSERVTPARRTLSVTGIGTVRVPADTVRLRFTVYGEGSTLALARQKSKELAKQIATELESLLGKHKLARKRVSHVNTFEYQPPPPTPGGVLLGEDFVVPPSAEPKPKKGTGPDASSLSPAAGPTPGSSSSVDTAFTIDLGVKMRGPAEIALLQQIIREVRDRCEHYPVRRLGPEAVTAEFSRRDTVAERRQALKAARDAAVEDAESLAGPGVTLEVIDVTEERALPVPDSITSNSDPSNRDPVIAGESNEPTGSAWTETPGRLVSIVPSGQENAGVPNFEIRAVVIVKCAH